MLLSYMNYYNETRTHLSLDKDAPYGARFSVFFAFQSWAGCITNIFGFDLRQAQVHHSTGGSRRVRMGRGSDNAGMDA